jgi:tRNA1(Val) A37 N6-methylase TrmN6
MHEQRSLFATVPIELEFPDGMASDIAAVLGGEYESGYSGAGLTIVDIGANVGAFSIWASLRWPDSVVHGYEPHPQTFEILRRNLATRPNVVCHNAAVYPGPPSQRAFYSR